MWQQTRRTGRISVNDSTTLGGLVVAVLTPLNADLSCDSGLLATHCRALLAQGCGGIALFGSTGEGPSFAVVERIAVLDALLVAGVPAERIVVGTGCPALPDAIALSRHAVAVGCAGVFAVPPYFFKGVSDDGLVEAYGRIIDGVAEPRLRLYLYSLPALVGFAVGGAVLGRLQARYPDTIAGIKDSSGDWPVMEALLRGFSDLRIFTGWEPHLPRAMALGAAGSVSGTANLIAEPLLGLCRGDASAATAQQVTALCEIVDSYPVVAALKALQAHFTGVPAWARLRPPLSALSAADQQQLITRIGAVGLTPVA